MSTSADLTRWAVIHRVRAGKRWLTIPRLFVEGVPVSVHRSAVVAALEAAGQAPLYSDGGIPWANHTVVPEAKWPTVWTRPPGVSAPARHATWDELISPSARRAVTLQLSPGLWASLTLAARAAGMTMQDWCVGTLSAAAELVNDDAPEPF